MKKSIYLNSDILTITTKKLEQASIQYETQINTNETGGTLFFEEADRERCVELSVKAMHEYYAAEWEREGKTPPVCNHDFFGFLATQEILASKKKSFSLKNIFTPKYNHN